MNNVKKKKENIRSIDENGNVKTFNSLKEASQTIRTRLDDWKVQLFIMDAINKNKRAFKCKWELIK